MNLLVCVVALGICVMQANSNPSSLGRPYLMECFKEAKKLVDDAYKYSREESLRRVRRDIVSPTDILRLMKQPRGDSRSAVRSADYMDQTLRLLHERIHRVHKRSLNATDLLPREDLEVLSKISGCSARVSKPSCRTIQNLDKYRTITSVCNNLNNPRLGSSNIPFKRWIPSNYEDGISLPIDWDSEHRYHTFLLPLVREVSNRILATTNEGVVSDTKYSGMLTQFGQWSDHDISHSPFTPSIRSFSNGINCDESCQRSEPCFPITIPPSDPRFKTGPNSCLPFFRSAPVCGTGYSDYDFGGVANKRQQINTVTSFTDLSTVYGSEDQLALDLRDLTSDAGLMRVNDKYTDNGRALLPFSPLKANMCATRRRITSKSTAEEVPCFLAGDVRANENVALTSLQTLFMREHNRLARELKRINLQWDSETLYQEARKIMGAYSQVFVYRDYLPHIVGDLAMNSGLGSYPGYSSNVDPSIASAFATAAYRFGHLAIKPVLTRLNDNYQENDHIPTVPLFKTFFTPWRLVFEGGIDPVIRGLVGSPAKLGAQEHLMVDAVRDRLFEFVTNMAQDLASLNMQRGRDHGIPGYNEWRKHCGLSEPSNQAELAQVLNNTDLATRFLKLYGTPSNIDVWVGGAAEPFVQGGRVGPLFSCLITNQFKESRQGDRFWYENPGVFTPAQKTALRSASLASVICENTGITSVPKDSFSLITARNPLVLCSNIPRINLLPWKEQPGKRASSGTNEILAEIKAEIKELTLAEQALLGNEVPQMEEDNEVPKA
ncbi:eosinophil peroxidase [Gadus morhua]|uniref:eosinophil peroxidase n=1 Tax=Gadus morhua TaxID=8049 RepID=UPI0011B4B7A0|nr:eosinophil peroxidase-like [Gadus morhua]